MTRHDLIDDIRAELDIALPRGTRPADTNAPVAWHQFDPATFDLGRGIIELEEATSIGIYIAERSIIDAFRRGTMKAQLRGVGHRVQAWWVGVSPERG